MPQGLHNTYLGWLVLVQLVGKFALEATMSNFTSVVHCFPQPPIGHPERSSQHDDRQIPYIASPYKLLTIGLDRLRPVVVFCPRSSKAMP